MVRELSVRPIVIQGLSVLLLCALIELSAGKVLEGAKEYLTALIPGLIIMVPPLLGLRGNINGALASRLGTGLNVGLIEPRLAMTTEIKINLISSLILSLVTSTTIGIFSFGINLLGGPPALDALQLLMKLVAIAIVVGLLSGLILAFLTILVAIESFKHGWDPDNVTSPTMATVGDFLSIACIYLAVFLVV